MTEKQKKAYLRIIEKQRAARFRACRRTFPRTRAWSSCSGS